jgi:DNA-binding NtrC family response regulator
LSSPARTFLLVEDDDLVRESTRGFFVSRGHKILEAATVAEAERQLAGQRPDAAIVDYQLPDGDGLSVVRAVRAVDASIPTVLLTAHGSIDLAVRAIKEGAEQFLTKPVELPTLLVVLERLVEKTRDRQAVMASRSRMARHQVDPFVGESPAIRRLAEQARRVAGSSACVLIEGESGTGKGVLAGWLHRNSPRDAEAFVDINCAGLSQEFLESELFGHEKGAFTGAVAMKQGLFELAHRGTLFLDEIGDADPQIQPKLLKAVEEQRFRRLGDVRDRQVDVRLIAATHHDLKSLVADKKFREDLYYRISAIPLFVPALRDRGRDVILLARNLLERISADVGFPGVKLSPPAEKALAGHVWPGNIRELRNCLERAVLLGDRTAVRAEDLAIVSSSNQHVQRPSGPRGTLSEGERAHIAAVLEDEGGDVKKAAAVLGLSRSALYEKLKKHQLVPGRG